MNAADALGALQADALAQLRAGEHSQLLVGFLTTSIMLELTKLVDPSLDLDGFATAAVDVLTQYAPIGQVALVVQADGLPGVHAEIGLPGSADGPVPGGVVSAIELLTGGSGFLDAHGIPEELQGAGFMEQVAGHLTQGLTRMVEFERLRRSAAAGRAVAAIAAIDESWSEQELSHVVAALAALPGACSAGISVSAARLGGPIHVVAGTGEGARTSRALVVDGRTPAEVWVHMASNSTADHAAKVDELLDAFVSALSRAEQGLRLREEAELDDLTRLGNRRVASRALAMARNLAERTGGEIAVLVCDLDGFKLVNDTFGHDVGDAVLVEFARAATSIVRAVDTVTRWGGEEFVVICPNCDDRGAAALADRLLAAIPVACASVLPATHRQTVSIGIASYPRHGTVPEALIRAADAAVFAAKRAGRNTHRIAVPPS